MAISNFIILCLAVSPCERLHEYNPFLILLFFPVVCERLSVKSGTLYHQY